MSTNLLVSQGPYVWTFRAGALYDGHNELTINWLQFLPDHGGTKSSRAGLVRSAKRFLLLRMEEPASKWRRGISAASVLSWYRTLRVFVHWMVQKNVWRFRDLTAEDLIQFLAERKARHSDRLPARGTQLTYIHLFEELWFLRREYPLSLKVDIREFEDEIWLKCRSRDNVPWRAIDERAALSLIADSMEWIRNYGAFFIGASRKIHRTQRGWVGKSCSHRAKLSRKLFAEICAHPTFHEVAAKTGCALDGWGLARAFTITVGAAINVLLLLIGQRVSELVRLDVGCVSKQVNDEGPQITYVTGIGAKSGGVVRKWVASDPVPEVIEFIEALYRDARRLSGVDALFVTRTQGSSIPLPGRNVRRMSTVSPVSAMKAFARAPFRSSGSAIENLHPHAARKTFAAFVVKRDKSALQALSLHFGHTYRGFTDGAYAGNLDLQKLLSAADQAEVARALQEVLTADRLAGRGSEHVKSYRERGGRYKGRMMLQQTIEALIDRGIRIAPCNWGYCLYSAPTSACRGDVSGPDELRRSPDVCASCANFVVTKSHMAWWDERAKKDYEFLSQPGVHAQAKLIVSVRLKRSQSILMQLLDGNGKGGK